MKVYGDKIIIYDQTAQEKKSAKATLRRESFVDDDWQYVDALEGTYTGARISTNPERIMRRSAFTSV